MPELHLLPPSKEKVEEDYQHFMSQLISAITLAGGSYNKEHWENMTLKEVYKVLRSNHIKLNFTATFQKG